MRSAHPELGRQAPIGAGPPAARILTDVRFRRTLALLLFLDIIVLSDTVLRFSSLGVVSVNSVNQPVFAWFWLIPLVTAAAGYLSSRHQAKKQKEANLAHQQMVFEQNQQMWHMQNEYNAPEAQKARLKEAGLNPNLVYGSGAVGGNQSGPAPSMQPTSVPVGGPMEIPQMLSAYQDFRMKEAQIDNVKALARNTMQKTISENIRHQLMRLKGMRDDVELRHAEHVRPYQAAVLGAQARTSELMVEKELQKLRLMSGQEQQQMLDRMYSEKKMQATDIDIERRQADLIFQRYRNEWMRMGITSSDNMILRILVRMASESGISQSMFDNFK